MELPYQAYFQAMPCYLTVQDRELKIIAANQWFREDFGEWSGRYCYQVYKHRSEKCEVCPVERTFRDGQCHSSEEQVKSLTGKEVAVIVYTTPIRNSAGEISAVMEMSTDITELKILQKQLKESQARYRLLFEEVPCYISIQDADLRIIEANRAFREEFGSFLGCKCYEIYKHRTEECYPCSVQQTFADGQGHESEEVITSRHGEPLNVLVSTAPIKNAEGKIVSVMEMSTNITQIRQLQSQLTSLGLLISSISHGIKGLLTGLDGGRYLVNSGLEKNRPERVQQGWEMVERNINRIRSMVLDILYYAKDREPDWETLSAVALVEEVCEVVAAKAREQKVELRRELDPAAGEMEADAKAVRALLLNLIDNSLDACRLDQKKSGHWVQVGVRGLPEHLEFTVQDNGIGMDQETRDKAFSLFFSSKGAEGTGLGLFISHKIARAHGGTIRIESELNHGSNFIVTLPRKRPAALPAEPVLP